MLILVCGDRNWENRAAIHRELSKYDPLKDVVMHGAARGADSIAGNVADQLRFAVKPYPADWEKHGKAAGPIRNRLMLEKRPDLVLAFHQDLESSKGTKDMCRIARAKGIPVEVFTS